MENFSIIGERLKDIRTKMNLSLSEAASLSGVSKTMLSQIERSESMPTIATLWKIANGLHIKFETLLQDTDKLYDIKSIDSITPVTDDDGRIQIYGIFPFSPISGIEFCYGVLKPGCRYTASGHKNSRAEHLMVSQGELELIVGNNTYRINAGSAIAFDSKETHTYVNNTDIDVLVYFVTSYE